ncbi:MAG: DUF5123 domain-containing protein [Armatimonadetes bacterium]|nr:MAG: DUF5123 domain-containing protein [Armatimonadota bacterium]
MQVRLSERRSRGAGIALAAVSALFVFTSANAADIHVPADQPTIQAAINVAQDFDRIIVADGVWSGPGFFDIRLNGKKLTVMSANGPENCIIDAQNQGTVFWLDHPWEDENAMIQGFTIRGGRSNFGAGIRCGSLSRGIVKDCIITGNFVEFDGGGIGIGSASPTFINCVIVNNRAIGGGGAVNVFNNSNATFINCTISGNQSAGGAVQLGGANPTATFVNCVIYGNNSPAAIQVTAGTATVSYSDVEGGFSGTGNIDADPLFVDPANGDFSIGAGSPAIDAGDNTAVPSGVTEDIAGNPRFVDDPGTPDTGNGTAPIVDMGAYEFSPEGGPIVPESVEVTRGAYQSGTLQDLFNSDDSYYNVEARRPTEIAAASVEIVVKGTAPSTTASVFEFVLEAATSGDPVRQRIELFNYQSGTWEMVDERDGVNGDTTVTITITNNASRFIDPNTREIKARIGYHDRGVTFPAWGGRFDQTVWNITS